MIFFRGWGLGTSELRPEGNYLNSQYIRSRKSAAESYLPLGQHFFMRLLVFDFRPQPLAPTFKQTFMLPKYGFMHIIQ
jgi:hypothetical protein